MSIKTCGLLAHPRGTYVTKALLLLGWVLLLSGCPSASNPTQPPSSSPSPSSSPPASSSTPSSEPALPSSSQQGSTSTGLPNDDGGNDEPWGDIGDSGDDGDSSDDAMADTASEPDLNDSTGANNTALPDLSDSVENTSEAELLEPKTSSESYDSSDPSTRRGQTDRGPTSDSYNTGPVLTASEQVALLDDKLNAGTGRFDDMILKEREAIRRTASGDTSSDYGSEDSSFDEFPGQVYDDTASGRPQTTDGQPGPVSPKRKGDYPQTAANHSIPADIPSGNDDDVVARQLREAAMREPDPTLSEKLWEEYRKYKGIK